MILRIENLVFFSLLIAGRNIGLVAFGKSGLCQCDAVAPAPSYLPSPSALLELLLL